MHRSGTASKSRVKFDTRAAGEMGTVPQTGDGIRRSAVVPQPARVLPNSLEGRNAP
jgi:hypothetical protein